MQGILLRGLSKRFKKVNFIFLSNRISSVCHSHVPYVMRVTCMRSYVIRMSLVCHPYVTRMFSNVIRMSLVCHSYVTRMSFVCTRMSLVCTRMSSVCHSYVLVYHSYVTRMYSNHSKVSVSSWNFTMIYYSI